MSVAGMDRRKAPSDDSGDYPGYCARPSCRKDIRRLQVRGHPRRFCDDDCRRAAQTEQRKAEAKLRAMEGLVRQARVDLAAFFADDPELAANADPHKNVEIALAQARVALRYISNPDSDGLRELRALVDAVGGLIEDTGAASVA